MQDDSTALPLAPVDAGGQAEQVRGDRPPFRLVAVQAGRDLIGDYDQHVEEGLALILTGIESRHGLR